MLENKIRSAFFREARSFYNLQSFQEMLELSEEDAKKVIEKLRIAGIVKATSRQAFDMERLQDEEKEVLLSDGVPVSSEVGYTFNFVGVAYTQDCVLKCFPKYIGGTKDFSEHEFFAEQKNLEHFKQVLKVIQKYNAENHETMRLYNGTESDRNFNRLAVQLYLLNDYFANGIYSNLEPIIETNGDGEIDWDRTINETLAIIKREKPYYVELQTVNTRTDDENYFTLLHECVLTECSKELESAGILSLFDLNPVALNSYALSDFGDADYIQYRLESEMKNQFVTRRQTLLKTLYVYIAERKAFDATEAFSFYGTNAFNMIWEKACGAIFDDVKDDPIEKLVQSGKLEITSPAYRTGTLKTLIGKASWQFGSFSPVSDKKGLEPDIISIEGKNFYILDGKYYFIDHNESEVKNQPDIQDVVKQFAYHKAFFDFLQFTDLTGVANAFLIPQKMPSATERNDFDAVGKVNLDLMQDYALNTLCPIQVVEINPSFVFRNYLSNTRQTKELLVVKAEPVQKGLVISKSSGFEMEKGKKLTLVGFLRDDYFRQIKENGFNCIFYFYRTKNGFSYPIHGELTYCQNFIGMNRSSEEIICGKITGSLQAYDKNLLKVQLKNLGYEKTNFSAESYYAFYISDISLPPKSDYAEVKKKIDAYHGNDVLSEFSPKVILDL